MIQRRRPSGFIEPCQPSKVARPPSGPQWVHEIKHDGYRLMVRRDGARVRCFTRNGHDWADRFPAIVDGALRIKATSFLIDGEAVIARDDGTPDFHALRSKRRGHEAALLAFDLIEHDGDDLRDLPLIERKRRLANLIGRAKRRSIRFTEHLTGDGPTIFEHVCRGCASECGVGFRQLRTCRRARPGQLCVPQPHSYAAANSIIRSPHRRGRAASLAFRGRALSRS
jgi:bifunctional non-homologous end joining protein LigD